MGLGTSSGYIWLGKLGVSPLDGVPFLYDEVLLGLRAVGYGGRRSWSRQLRTSETKQEVKSWHYFGLCFWSLGKGLGEHLDKSFVQMKDPASQRQGREEVQWLVGQKYQKIPE